MVSQATHDNSMTLGELLGHVGVDLEARPTLAARRVHGVRLDSRQVGDGDLYLALRGATTHGLRHAADALARGAIAVAIDANDHAALDETSQQILDALEHDEAPVLSVAELAQRAGELAGQLLGHPDRSLTVVAVTGTDGKTSVCRFIAAALDQLGIPCGYIGTLGWGRGDVLEDTALTTPDAPALVSMLASLRDNGAKAVALEASSHGLATGRLDGLAIDVAVLTNIGRDHLDFHGSLAEYREAKSRLFDWPTLSAVVINGDDELGSTLCKDLGARKPGLQQHGFGLADSLHADEVNASTDGLSFTLVDGTARLEVQSALMGRFNVDNLLACHGVLKALGHSATEASEALATLKPVPGRMERFAADERPTVVVDYAHTPQALDAAIAATREHCKGELWVVFGCGGDRDRGKRAPMGRASEAADRIVITDDNPRHEQSADIIRTVLDGMSDPDRAVVIADRASAITHAVSSASIDDVVLIAGKGHEDYQIVGSQRLSLSDRDCVRELLAEAC